MIIFIIYIVQINIKIRSNAHYTKEELKLIKYPIIIIDIKLILHIFQKIVSYVRNR